MQKWMIASCLGLLSASPVTAASLVKNGNFEQTVNGPGQIGYNTDAIGWYSSGYNFLFDGSTSDTVGSQGIYGTLSLWGPGTGSANGLTHSPTGGNFVAADGAFGVSPISQVIFGLTAGQKYKVGFDWAGAQQAGFNGPQTEQWQVSLGSESYSTAVYSNPTHGFSGWMHEVFSFTATGPTEVLSFLAHGTPDGVPPFSLIDGVTMAADVPEPATWAMMVMGFGLIGGAMRSDRRRLATAS